MKAFPRLSADRYPAMLAIALIALVPYILATAADRLPQVVLRTDSTPVADHVWSVADVVSLSEAAEPAPNARAT